VFPQTFVISMTRSVERRRDVITHLNSLKIDFNIVDAVDGSSLSKDFIGQTNEAALRGEIGRTLSPGEIGCALSHLGIYRTIVDEGGGPYLILEDDVELSRAFMEIIKRVDSLPPDWELINFCGSSPLSAFGAPLWDIYRPARFRGNPSHDGGIPDNGNRSQETLETRIATPPHCRCSHRAGRNDGGEALWNFPPGGGLSTNAYDNFRKKKSGAQTERSAETVSS